MTQHTFESRLKNLKEQLTKAQSSKDLLSEEDFNKKQADLAGKSVAATLSFSGNIFGGSAQTGKAAENKRRAQQILDQINPNKDARQAVADLETQIADAEAEFTRTRNLQNPQFAQPDPTNPEGATRQVEDSQASSDAADAAARANDPNLSDAQRAAADNDLQLATAAQAQLDSKRRLRGDKGRAGLVAEQAKREKVRAELNLGAGTGRRFARKFRNG